MKLSTILRRIAFVFRRRHYWYAVRNKRTRSWYCGRDHDDCEFSVEFGRAEWFDDADEAFLSVLVCAQCRHPADFQLVQLTARFNSNHFAMKEIPW